MQDMKETPREHSEHSAPLEDDGLATPVVGKHARHGLLQEGRFMRVHQIAEFVSFIALIVGAPAALLELHNRSTEQKQNEKKERIEAAETVYREVDQRFVQFTRLCIDHPRLDCYSIPRAGAIKPPLTEDEAIQQKILYSDLTDLFEVAYVDYHPKHQVDQEIRDIFEEQWRGWDHYIREFFERPAYRKTWDELDGEYDRDFTEYMHALAHTPLTLSK